MAKVSRVAVLLTWVVLACFINADARELLQPRSECPGEPPEGDWLVDDRIPNPANDTLALHYRFVLTLTKLHDNIFRGSAGGVAVRDTLIFLMPQGTPVSLKMLGFWDADTCVMTAVLFNLDNLLTDPVQLVYDGETLSGPYLNVINGTSIFDRTAFLSLSPID